jgi:Holliday junction resolvasome RuvABC endonuclease subunit
VTRVLGLDLSLTATGYAYGDEVVGVFKPKARSMQRLADIRSNVLELAHVADVVVLEGYAFARPNQAHQLGELGGVIRLELFERGIPFVEIAPATLKLFATGRGNADKGAMIAAAIRRFGFEGDNDNAADAWILRAMGLVQYDTLPIALPARALEALERVTWPKLDVVERVDVPRVTEAERAEALAVVGEVVAEDISPR